jgi:sterol desaturase/sphingolipid hydroxylase (fatty acid hydroxylase superfamily)
MIQMGWVVIGVLVLAMVLEASVARARRRPYDLADAAANLALYAGHVGILTLWTPWLFLLYAAVHEHALLDLSRLPGPLAWGLLVVSEDLCFYLFHRASHRCRLLWASHQPHHSSTQFNWSVGLRQSWTPFFAAPFWLPLALVGFEPVRVLAVQMVSLTFQALLHTERVGLLGPLEWVLNTPRHHRVHHGAMPACIDRNFGGVFIFWDRLLGTFAHCEGDVSFGTGEGPRSVNPLRIAVHEWAALVRDLGRSRSPRAVLRALLLPRDAMERTDR